MSCSTLGGRGRLRVLVAAVGLLACLRLLVLLLPFVSAPGFGNVAKRLGVGRRVLRLGLAERRLAEAFLVWSWAFHAQRPLGFYGVAYHSALVPIFGTDVNTEAMARAAKLVGPDAEVEALYVLTVPRELELQQGLDEEEQLARNVLEVARLQARARDLKVRARLIRTRNPGAAIVEEATSRHSDLIYISTGHAPSGERLLGPTTRYVLANRPPAGS